MTDSRLPHEGVHVRLGCSPRHGVGVFAGQHIPAGTNVFESDQRPIRWVSAAELAGVPLTDFHRAFYEDFSIRRGGDWGCPADFNQLSVGWYVNEPASDETANLTASPTFDLIAARDIASGEELTVTYASFSQGGW